MSHYEWWDVRAQIVERKEKQSWLTLIRNSSSAATNKVNPELQQTLYYTHIMNSEQKVNNWFADVTRARKHCHLKRMVLNKSCFSSCKFLFMYFFFFFLQHAGCNFHPLPQVLLIATLICFALPHDFLWPFHTLCSSFSETTHSIFEHIIHNPLEPGNLTHGPRLLKGFVRALHSNFPPITGNRPGGVHMNAPCRCFTWPRAQHDIFQPYLLGIMFIYSSFATANMRET